MIHWNQFEVLQYTSVLDAPNFTKSYWNVCAYSRFVEFPCRSSLRGSKKLQALEKVRLNTEKYDTVGNHNEAYDPEEPISPLSPGSDEKEKENKLRNPIQEL